ERADQILDEIDAARFERRLGLVLEPVEAEDEAITLLQLGEIACHRKPAQSRILGQQLRLAALDAHERVEFVRGILMGDAERGFVERPLVHPAIGARDPEAKSRARGQDFHPGLPQTPNWGTAGANTRACKGRMSQQARRPRSVPSTKLPTTIPIVR